MESDISKYLGEDNFLAWKRQDLLIPVCFGDAEFPKLISVTIINRRGKSVTYLLSTGMKRSIIDIGQLQF